jgi:putative transcriptional regulator
MEPVAGTLLIAEPFLKDPNFQRTVVLICEHQEAGSFGFVLNKQMDNTLDEFMPDLDDLPLPVNYGGPVQPDTLHFLHQSPDVIPGSYEVTKGVYWGGDFKEAVARLRDGSIKPGQIRFFIGYSGWSGGQLNDELKENSWILGTAKSQLVFHRQLEQIWKDSLRSLGGEYELMVNFPTDPQLN